LFLYGNSRLAICYSFIINLHMLIYLRNRFRPSVRRPSLSIISDDENRKKSRRHYNRIGALASLVMVLKGL
jgi:hypothetical protein